MEIRRAHPAGPRLRLSFWFPSSSLGTLPPQTMVFIIPGAAWRWPQASAARPELGSEVGPAAGKTDPSFYARGPWSVKTVGRRIGRPALRVQKWPQQIDCLRSDSMNLHQVLGPAKRTLLLAMLDHASGKRLPDLRQLAQLGPLGRIDVDEKSGLPGLEFLPPDQSTAGTTTSHPPEGGRQPAQENQPCQKRLIGSPQDARRLQRFGAKIGTGS